MEVKGLIRLTISMKSDESELELHHFNHESLLIDFMHKLIFDADKVYLLAFNDEIVVTESIIDFVENLECLSDNSVYLFTYNTYESAYRNALQMREENKKCYN